MDESTHPKNSEERVKLPVLLPENSEVMTGLLSPLVTLPKAATLVPDRGARPDNSLLVPAVTAACHNVSIIHFRVVADFITKSVKL